MNKIENEIKRIIYLEIQGDLSTSNLHGTNLNKCLVEPYLETFEDSFETGITIQLYVVLKEQVETGAGYQIVYDPKCKKFGLTVPGKGNLRVFLGYYGSFLETLMGM